ncbi:flagellar assembly protein FliH [Shouchella clausii]|nr:flagellar assembly protein FliH [Shouchella clausii]
MEMTSLSNVIRSTKNVSIAREIGIKPLYQRTRVRETRQELAKEEAEFEQIQEKAEAKAAQLIEEAQAQATAIEKKMESKQAELEQQWEKARLKAEQEGYDAGFTAGESQAKAIYESTIAEAKQVLEEAQAAAALKVDKEQPLLIELACAIAEKVIGVSIAEDPYLQNIVRAALAEVRDHAFVKLYVPPHWYKRLAACVDELQGAIPACEDFQLIPDGQLQDDHCFIVTNAGRMDASLPTQIEQLKKQLHEAARCGSFAKAH